MATFHILAARQRGSGARLSSLGSSPEEALHNLKQTIKRHGDGIWWQVRRYVLPERNTSKSETRSLKESEYVETYWARWIGNAWIVKHGRPMFPGFALTEESIPKPLHQEHAELGLESLIPPGGHS